MQTIKGHFIFQTVISTGMHFIIYQDIKIFQLLKIFRLGRIEMLYGIKHYE